MIWISLARGDCIGWGHLFLSATLTQCLRARTELKLNSEGKELLWPHQRRCQLLKLTAQDASINSPPKLEFKPFVSVSQQIHCTPIMYQVIQVASRYILMKKTKKKKKILTLLQFSKGEVIKYVDVSKAFQKSMCTKVSSRTSLWASSRFPFVVNSISKIHL